MCTVIQQIHISILKYTVLDFMQQQQVPLQKSNKIIIIMIIK